MIRSARASDHGWIRDTAALVYRELGDYGIIIPSWVEHPGVLVYLDEDAAHQRRGFILVGFYVSEGDDDVECIADLLAIAVSPAFQKRGVGRRLLAYAIDVARRAVGERRVTELRLTVAESNAVARAMFEKAGFRVVDAEYGMYDGGQKALRMGRPL